MTKSRLVAVLEAQQLRTVMPASGRISCHSSAGLHRRHQQLERAGAVHFLAHDVLDLAHAAQAKGVQV